MFVSPICVNASLLQTLCGMSSFKVSTVKRGLSGSGLRYLATTEVVQHTLRLKLFTYVYQYTHICICVVNKCIYCDFLMNFSVHMTSVAHLSVLCAPLSRQTLIYCTSVCPGERILPQLPKFSSIFPFKRFFGGSFFLSKDQRANCYMLCRF